MCLSTPLGLARTGSSPRHRRFMKREAPAAERNKSFIIETLGDLLPRSGLVLETASGSGQHAVALAAAFPALVWQPSDPDPGARASIDAYRAEYDGTNLRPALDLDVTAPWPVDGADAVININMVHISPWAATTALIGGAAVCLPAGAPLILYGPYQRNGRHTAPSNEQFDAWLKAKDRRFGVRHLEAVAQVAREAGFGEPEAIAMPANNFTVVFRRR